MFLIAPLPYHCLLFPSLRTRLAQSEQTGAVGSASGRGVPGSIPVRGVACCGFEQVKFPQLRVYSVHMFLR